MELDEDAPPLPGDAPPLPVPDDKGFEELKNNAVICTICQKTFAYTGGTTNLREHIKRFHPRIIGELTPDPILYKPITEFLVSSPRKSGNFRC